MRLALNITALILVAACASTDVTPLSRNEFLITTSAAPACGTSGARRVVTRMAAVQTIRNGYDRFVIAGARTQNNVTVVPTGPSSAYTTGQAMTHGDMTYGSATTTYSGGSVMFFGSNDADLHVIMLRPGDAGYENGIDARQALGPDWERLVRPAAKQTQPFERRSGSP